MEKIRRAVKFSAIDQEVELGSDVELSSTSRALFLEKVRLANTACQAGEFESAVRLYSEAISLDPANHVLFSNRSAARVKLGQLQAAHQDGLKAAELSPHWSKAPRLKQPAGHAMGRTPAAAARASAQGCRA
ncbi:Tetratricopeptide repeat protein 28 [Amphibalanus amphitrite]|uniref:Tetratricopeptide repeat protein 28 n=1 Tax=Amphibalanus amphitrite TaxID=1232801 RepID=A0A6A4WN74_AMPAM|nr:Tetratricopeptide repeat protein 28 [Amphibalanus amphitrite]